MEMDEQFRLRPRGGRKRKGPDIEKIVMRKRVSAPRTSDSILNQGTDYVSWLLLAGADENQH